MHTVVSSLQRHACMHVRTSGKPYTNSAPVSTRGYDVHAILRNVLLCFLICCLKPQHKNNCKTDILYCTELTFVANTRQIINFRGHNSVRIVSPVKAKSTAFRRSLNCHKLATTVRLCGAYTNRILKNKKRTHTYPPNHPHEKNRQQTYASFVWVETCLISNKKTRPASRPAPPDFSHKKDSIAKNQFNLLL